MSEPLPVGRVRRFPLLVLALLIAAPGTILADTADRLEEGRRLFEVEVDYDGALGIFLSILEDEDAPPEQRQEARLQASFCLVALDRMDEARALMVQALVEDPDYQLPPYTSPKLVEALEAARAEAASQAPKEEVHAAGAFAEPVSTSAGQDPARSPSLWPWSAALGGGAVAALGTGTYYAIAASRSEDRLLNDPTSFASQAEALEFRESAIAQARRANWFFVAGALLAVGSGTMFALDGWGAGVSATPTPDGLMVMATGTW